jgi:acyl-coenzyme A synthetase/AMP-(fatty) acid ligase
VYPYDVESAAERAAGVRSGRSAAFGAPNEASGTEDLVLVCETRLGDAGQRQELTREIIACVFAATGLRPDAVHLAPPRSLSRTSSGKIRRAEVRARFLRGELELAAPRSEQES